MVTQVFLIMVFHCTYVTVSITTIKKTRKEELVLFCYQISLSVTYMVLGTGFLRLNNSGYNANHLE